MTKTFYIESDELSVRKGSCDGETATIYWDNNLTSSLTYGEDTFIYQSKAGKVRIPWTILMDLPVLLSMLDRTRGGSLMCPTRVYEGGPVSSLFNNKGDQ